MRYKGGETLTLSGSGTSANANVANGIAMSSNGDLALVDGTGLGFKLPFKLNCYQYYKRVLNSSGSKFYDANTNALDANISLSNLVSGELLNHSGTATISSANAGSYTITNLAGITISNGVGGTASNYTLRVVHTTSQLTQRLSQSKEIKLMMGILQLVQAILHLLPIQLGLKPL